MSEPALDNTVTPGGGDEHHLTQLIVRLQAEKAMLRAGNQVLRYENARLMKSLETLSASDQLIGVS